MMKRLVTKAKVEEEGGENKINNEQQKERESGYSAESERHLAGQIQTP